MKNLTGLRIVCETDIESNLLTIEARKQGFLFGRISKTPISELMTGIPYSFEDNHIVVFGCDADYTFKQYANDSLNPIQLEILRLEDEKKMIDEEIERLKEEIIDYERM